MIYMQARFYLPMYGRFASPDPGLDQHFQDTQSWNIYSYVRNQPTMQIHPDGMDAIPGQRLCQINKERGNENLEIEFLSDVYILDRDVVMRFPLSDFEAVLKEAKEALLTCD